MSRILVDQIRSNSASADAITLDGSGNLTIPGNATCSGTATGFGGGITMADNWRINSGFAGEATPIANNWERGDGTFEGYMGSSGLTESSGVFTFPSTGWYFVTFQHYVQYTTSVYNEMYLQFTSDSGSNWTDSVHTSCWTDNSSTTYQMATASQLFDLTNVSTQKMRFRIRLGNTNTSNGANSAYTLTGFYIIRLGDT